MKILQMIFAGLILFGLLGTAQAQQAVRMRVQLIAADQAEGPSDPALSALMSKLQRMPFKRFLQKGNTTAALAAGQTVRADLNGHAMNLTLESVEGGRARVHVNWIRGRDSVADITVVTQPGAPFVCGGPREGDLTWIAVFSAQ